MSKTTLLVIIVLGIFAALLGYNYVVRPFGSPAMPVAMKASPSPKADSAVKTFEMLTPEEKTALLLAAPLEVKDGQANPEMLTWIENHQPGIITIFGDKISTQSARAVMAKLRTKSTALSFPPLVGVDHEGGTVQRFNGEGFTLLPSWRSICQLSGENRTRLLLNSANELQDLGINIVYAPVIDLQASGSALGNRTCGSNPDTVAEISSEFIRILAGQKILPVIKHFPGIGGVTRDLHQAPATIDIEKSEQELLVYDKVLSSFPSIGTMITHVSIKDSFEGEPCSLSSECVQGFRKTYPSSIIISDALDMASAAVDPTATQSAGPQRLLEERALRAAAAGNMILLFGPGVTAEDLERVHARLAEQYKNDAEFKAVVDESATRINSLLEGASKVP